MTEHKIVTVKIKYDDEKTIKQKFSIYDDMTVCSDDLVVKSCIRETKANYPGEPESIQVTIQLEIL